MKYVLAFSIITELTTMSMDILEENKDSKKLANWICNMLMLLELTRKTLV